MTRNLLRTDRAIEVFGSEAGKEATGCGCIKALAGADMWGAPHMRGEKGALLVGATGSGTGAPLL